MVAARIWCMIQWKCCNVVTFVLTKISRRGQGLQAIIKNSIIDHVWICSHNMTINKSVTWPVFSIIYCVYSFVLTVCVFTPSSCVLCQLVHMWFFSEGSTLKLQRREMICGFCGTGLLLYSTNLGWCFVHECKVLLMCKWSIKLWCLPDDDHVAFNMLMWPVTCSSATVSYRRKRLLL